jgi:hypothetical protein
MLHVKPQEKQENRESIVNELRMAHHQKTATQITQSMDTSAAILRNSKPKISINALLGGTEAANLKPYL